MKFSILSKNKDNTTAYWIVNHIGTIDSVRKKAERINAVNGNTLDLIIVDEVINTTPMLDLFNITDMHIY